ncbi:MAG: hypothetical protein TU36_005585 [Vulcanisaeta sp. AZ3]|jgi:hypothetical protein|nr:MAG: hypothetical protein TU36_05880 [Vulcanisaeta sp. AZ3]
MKNKGSLSTIIAGILVLLTLTTGIIIGITTLSTITTLTNLASNHVKTVGEESALYSGLIIQGNKLTSTKGPITIISAINKEGTLTIINETTQTYTTNTTTPQLLLTNVGPILIDPTNTLNQTQTNNPINNYLWNWVTAVITTNNGQNQYTGIIITLANQYYLLHINPNYAIGPLTVTNTYITKDYGAGLWGCQATYGGLGVGGAWTTCPAPNYANTAVYKGPWPQITITPINNTTIKLTITLLKGTSFIRTPKNFTLYILNQNKPQWINPTCQGPHLITKCTFDMTWIQYPYQKGTACYNGGWIWCTLPENITYNITINMKTQTPQNYYLIMIIHYPPGFPNQWFTWNITNTKPNTPIWLDTPTPNATILTP